MLHYVRCQVTLPNEDTIPSDAAMNTWHFGTNEVDPADALAEIATRLEAFYTLALADASPCLTGFIEGLFYNLAEAPPRVPIGDFNVSFITPTGQPLPNECAIVLSYRANPVSGIPAARLRGRIYLGPFNTTAVANSTGGAVVDSGTQLGVTTAAEALAAANDSTATWVIFSPTTAGAPPWTQPELEAASHEVTGGFVDNAWDTQRRRGIASTVRVPWSP